jgi:hypothetical protein
MCYLSQEKISCLRYTFVLFRLDIVLRFVEQNVVQKIPSPCLIHPTLIAGWFNIFKEFIVAELFWDVF